MMSLTDVQLSTYLHSDYTRETTPGLNLPSNYRLGSASLDSTRFHTNTQKSEAANRVYSLRNPKNITFSRNFPGRIHSAVHQINNGASQSLCVQLNQVGCPITPGSKVAEQLKFKEKRQSYIKDYKKSEIARKCRRTLRYNKYNLYDSKRKDKPDYQRQLLDSQVTLSDTVVSNVNTRCQHLTDHNYTKFLF